MEITNIKTFVAYYKKTRGITKTVIDVIPKDKLDWTYSARKFTIGDLIRHIAAIERYVFAAIALGNKPSSKGCGKEIIEGYESPFAYFDAMHLQSINIFETLTDSCLRNKITSVDGKQIELGNFLRALIVHEIHHRAALCIYLNLLGIATPPIIGLTEEQVIQLSK